VGRVKRNRALDRARVRRWGIVGAAATVLLLGLQVVDAAPSLAATGKAIGSGSVPIYSGPGNANSASGSVPVGTTVSFHCFVAGQRVSGPYGAEDLWDALDSGGYIPDALIYTGSNSAVVPACPSAQFGTGTYPVAWTGGGGAQPESGTSTGSGADGGVIADGTLVTVVCETTGSTLTDSAGFSGSLWDQLGSGAYIPNVYLDTQVNGPTPGLPRCSTPAPVTSSAPPPPPAGGGGSSGAGEPGGSGGSSGSPGGTSDSGGSSLPAHASDPCVPAYGLGAQSTHSIFLGKETDFSRTASLYQICEGFPFSEGVPYSTAMKCAALAAIVSLAGNPEANEKLENLCDASDVVDAYNSGDWLGAAAGKGCELFSDVFSEGMSILAAGAAAETGPAAVTLGVAVYRALNATLHVVCGAVFDGGAKTFGYNLETHHEVQVASDIANKAKCLQSRTVLGAEFWSAVSC
jgi:hypothetical protein